MADFLAEGFVVHDDRRLTLLPSAEILDETIASLDVITLEFTKKLRCSQAAG